MTEIELLKGALSQFAPFTRGRLQSFRWLLENKGVQKG